jgi:hypothetical protein
MRTSFNYVSVDRLMPIATDTAPRLQLVKSDAKKVSFAEFKKLVKGNQGFRILTPGNPKTDKGKIKGYHTFILHLAPADLSGWNVCSMFTVGCKAACLNTAGRGGIMANHGTLSAVDVENGIRNTIQNARIRRTQLFFTDRHAFMSLLVKEISKAIRKANSLNLIPVFRLNGTSDIRYESIKDTNGKTIFDHFPNVQFYDYTKIANRKNLPSNYALTFSLADGNETQAAIAQYNGLNVAAVFRNKDTVARYQRDGISLGGFVYPVANGDETDLRFLDPANHVIALYAKGNAKNDRSGFVRD